MAMHLLKRYPNIKDLIKKVCSSAWLFPVLLSLLLIFLTITKISGSSIGIYHAYFYGNTKDPSLIAGKPRPIRSDEWVVNTQLTIAQKNNGYKQINTNLGNGEDMSVLLDVPYKDWSEFFKPHNWAFFVLPFDNAFAFKWWIMGYLATISCYFFILALLPKRRLLAATLSIAFLFSAFFQWWYEYATLASVYYSLFFATAFIYFLRQKNRVKSIALGAVMAYTLIAFVVVLYPPFQIACGLSLAAFCAGYALEQRINITPKEWLTKLAILMCVAIVAGGVTLTFLGTRSNVVHTIENTAYPGKRVVPSGGFNAPHLLLGQLGSQFLSDVKANAYQIPSSGLVNQSESSNFILLLPFLFLPILYLTLRNYREKIPLDWPLITTSVMFIIFMAWLFVPHLPVLGTLLQLNKVPLTRLLIGLGLLNLMQLTLLIRNLDKGVERRANTTPIIIYGFLILCAELILNIHTVRAFPGFIGLHKAIALALPIPVIIVALLKRRPQLAALAFLALSLYAGLTVNPLYRSTDILTRTPISSSIKNIAANQSGRWAVETSILENFAVMNGGPSISGVYPYPQLSLWNPINNGKDTFVYNRYAHVVVNLDRTPQKTIPTYLKLSTADHFGVVTEPCSTFLKTNGVRLLITPAALSPDDICARLIKKVTYPQMTSYIYKLY